MGLIRARTCSVTITRISEGHRDEKHKQISKYNTAKHGVNPIMKISATCFKRGKKQFKSKWERLGVFMEKVALTQTLHTEDFLRRRMAFEGNLKGTTQT